MLSIGRRALLWAPSHPNLVDAVLTLRDGDEVVDEVRSYLGLRQVGVRAGLFELNRVPTYLRLVLGQGYCRRHTWRRPATTRSDATSN